MAENVIQINGGITINVNVMYVKQIIFETLLHVVVKMENIWESIMDGPVITCDEIIEDEAKTVTINFHKNNAISK